MGGDRRSVDGGLLGREDAWRRNGVDRWRRREERRVMESACSMGLMSQRFVAFLNEGPATEGYVVSLPLEAPRTLNRGRIQGL